MSQTAPTSPKDISKKLVAAQLKEAAKLLDVLGDDPFRAKAFYSAARNVEAFEGDMNVLIRERRLSEIRSVGKTLAEEIYSLEDYELLPVLSELHERVPEGVRSLFSVSGLGAKKVAALWGMGIESLDDLLAAAQDGRIAELKGFGEKSAEKIAMGAAFALNAKKRMRMNVAKALADALQAALQAALPDAHIAITGSQRRRLETVGNINVLVAGASAEQVATILSEHEDINVLDVLEEGVHAQIEGRDIFVIFTQEDDFGAALLWTTGNEDYLQSLVEQAKGAGLEFNQTGLYQDGEKLSTLQEQDVLDKLSLPYIVPERREFAEPEPVSNLITVQDIRGQIHNHSTWSDAVHGVREMVAAARAGGWSYLGMADHSRTSYYANGLSIERVYAQAQEIRDIRAELAEEGSDFGLLHGIEVDIMPDGSLDYPDDVLATLDYTVVSVHQNFTLSKAKQTERIVRAVENPHAKILGHLTGRILLRRPSYEVDQLAIIDACAETGTIIEINASPYRLDMDWRMVITAKERGCRFSINPDAHHRDGFADIYYGALVARKAGLTPADVVNTAPDAASFLAQLK